MDGPRVYLDISRSLQNSCAQFVTVDRRRQLTATCADGLVSGGGFAAQLVSEFNQAKIQVALACTHKFKTGKAVRFA